jgi:Protein of unknown function (DUF2808)
VKSIEGLFLSLAITLNPSLDRVNFDNTDCSLIIKYMAKENAIMDSNSQLSGRVFKRLEKGFIALLLGTTLTLTAQAVSTSARSQELPTAFETGLRLTRAESTYDAINAYPAVYQFTVQVPEAAKQPLSRITITAPDTFGGFGMNMPSKESVSAFISDNPDDKRHQYPQRMVPAQISMEGRNIIVDFPEPIAVQQAVTVQFPYMRNPAKAGTYLFEVNAAPPGSNPVNQFVGFGRLVIRENHHT